MYSIDVKYASHGKSYSFHMNFEASKVQSKFDINEMWLPYPGCELKSHYPKNKKRRLPVQGSMTYSETARNKGSLAFCLWPERAKVYAWVYG